MRFQVEITPIAEAQIKINSINFAIALQDSLKQPLLTRTDLFSKVQNGSKRVGIADMFFQQREI